MIAAGETTGTTLLRVTADELTREGAGPGERLALVFVVDGESVGGLAFTVWDAAAPALPAVAHLLLAFGGYRRRRRRQA